MEKNEIQLTKNKMDLNNKKNHPLKAFQLETLIVKAYSHHYHWVQSYAEYESMVAEAVVIVLCQYTLIVGWPQPGVHQRRLLEKSIGRS